MTELLPPSRPRTGGQSVYLRYEKAGLLLPAYPVPWNAESVLVEVLLKLPPSGRQRTDYVIRGPGLSPVTAEHLSRDSSGTPVYRLGFRLPTPAASASVELLWKHRLLTTISIPVMTEAEYRTDLRLGNATVSARIDGQFVPARTFVCTQATGLLASAVLRSSSALAPLTDLGLTVSFRNDRTGQEYTVSVPLSASQLAGKEALVAASPPKLPRAAGEYAVSWAIGGRVALTQRIAAVTARKFVDSLRVSEARFVIADEKGGVRPVRQPPVAGEAIRTGPCFVLSSREPGAAGRLELTVATQTNGPEPGPVIFRETVLVTDGPTVFAPGLLDTGQLESVIGFELRYQSRVLGGLSFRPVPSASLNAEGAFKPAPEFTWSTGAEDELSNRLAKLMGESDNMK